MTWTHISPLWAGNNSNSFFPSKTAYLDRVEQGHTFKVNFLFSIAIIQAHLLSYIIIHHFFPMATYICHPISQWMQVICLQLTLSIITEPRIFKFCARSNACMTRLDWLKVSPKKHKHRELALWLSDWSNMKLKI